MPVVNPEGVLRARVDQPSIAAPGYTLGNRILPLYCTVAKVEGYSLVKEGRMPRSTTWASATSGKMHPNKPLN